MKKILSTRVLVKICVLTTILLVLIIYTIWGNSALMVSMVNISSDRIASAFSNFRIAQVSDLHNAEFGESNTELIELLSEHEPDIIVITGDLIDAGHTDIEIAFDFIKISHHYIYYKFCAICCRYKVEALDYVLKLIQYFAFSQVPLHNAVKKKYMENQSFI